MRGISFTSAAREELIEAQDWYEAEAAGLGKRFLTAIDNFTGRVHDNPYHFPIVFSNVRRAVLSRFPYCLFFIIDDDQSLLVIACFHASHNPRKWQVRI